MDSYSPEKQVLVVGYPRSGNTWLARLLGDVLNSPVTGWKNAHPLAEEGADRPGDYVVRQLHLHPVYNDHPDFITSPYEANINAWNGEKIIHIMRDPRDVAVSIYHYWERESIDEAIRVMTHGTHPVAVHGPWIDFVCQWFRVSDAPVYLSIIEPPIYHLSYEMLKREPTTTLLELLHFFDIERSIDDIYEAVKNQSFDNRRKDIEGSGDKYNYGETIQLKAMRSGITGDWRNHFGYSQENVADFLWGEFIEKYKEFFE